MNVFDYPQSARDPRVRSRVDVDKKRNTINHRPTRVLRVALVESVPLLGLGLQTIIGTDPALTWAGWGGTAASAVDLCKSDHPDVLLINSRVDPGWKLCQMLTGMFRGLMVVALLAETPNGHNASNQTAATQARLHGARGVVPLDAEARRLITAIRTTADRGHYVDPSLDSSQVLPKEERERLCGKPLSRREFEVLQLIADGRTADYIGNRLGITADTVRTHVGHILRKLHARDRAHAVARAFEMSLLSSAGRRAN